MVDQVKKDRELEQIADEPISLKDVKVTQTEGIEFKAEEVQESQPVKSRASWRPANIIEIPERFKEKGFRYYCADWKRAGRIQQKIQEGWIVDKSIVPKMRAAGMIPDLPASLQDGLPKDDTLQIRELIVLKLPEELALEREKYYASKDPLNKKIAEEEENFGRQTGGRAYGDIKL